MNRDSWQAVRAVFLAAIMVISVFAGGIVFSGSAAAQESDLIVDDDFDNPDQATNFSSIQNAVDNATEDDIIVVRSGTYEESVTIDVEGLTLEGAGADATTINASSDPINLFDGTVAVKIAADDVEVDGFTVEGAGASVSFTGIEGVEVRNNVLKNGLLGLNGGGDIENNSGWCRSVWGNRR